MNSRASKRTDKGQQKQRYVAKQGPADHGGDESDDKLPSGAFALAIRTDGFPAGGGGGSGLTSRSSQIALGNIRRVLGSGFKPNDPAGYRDLLNRSFDLKTVDGHIEATWRPAGWNGKSSPVDLSPEWHVLHSSMEGTVKELKRQIESLEPLCDVEPDHCCEDVRDLICERLDGLLIAIADGGEPARDQVDFHFEALGAADSGLLKSLRDEYVGDVDPHGEEQIACPEDACRLANYELIEKEVGSLNVKWERFKETFLDGVGGVSHRIRQMRRRLSVISQAVTDVIRGLQLAGWNAAALDLQTLPGSSTTRVGPLLRWMKEFAGRRGPATLQRPGREALRAIHGEANNLHTYAEKFHEWVEQRIGGDLIDETMQYKKSVADDAKTGRDPVAPSADRGAQIIDIVVNVTGTFTEESLKSVSGPCNKSDVILNCKLKVREALNSFDWSKDCNADEIAKKATNAWSSVMQGAFKGEHGRVKLLHDCAEALRKRIENKIEPLCSHPGKEGGAPNRPTPTRAGQVSDIACSATTGARWLLLGIPASAAIIEEQLKALFEDAATPLKARQRMAVSREKERGCGEQKKPDTCSETPAAAN